MTHNLNALLHRLTTAQKAALTAGADYWRTVAIPEAGITALKVTDGPIGARGDMTTDTTAMCFPCGTALGATWDVELAADLGRALAFEARTKAAHVLLAPTVNLHRHPYAGRNFECMSEDPELTARLATALIGGLQGAGVGASLKHFVANDQETDRMTVSVQVDERTLRELYLRPFEAAVAIAEPWTVMAAYNRINGDFATENRALLTDVLMQEWGYTGVVVSDWWATHDTLRAAGAGLHLEMPGPAAWLGEKLMAAVTSGELDIDVLDGMALRMLRLLERVGRIDATDAEPAEQSLETPEQRALARRVAAQSTVLLTNRDHALPLDASTLRRVAVIGPAADPGLLQGGGSAQVPPHRRVSPLDGLRDALPGVEVTTVRGCPLGRFVQPIDPLLLGEGWRVRFWHGPRTGDPFHEDTWSDMRYSYLARKLPGLRAPSPMSATCTTTFVPDQSGTWRFQLSCAGRATVSVDSVELLRHDEDGPSFAIFPDELPSFDAGVDCVAGVAVEVAVTLDVVTEGVLPSLHVGAIAPDPTEEIGRAAAAAAAADVAVLVVGTGPEFESEGLDRRSLALPGDQPALIDAVLAAQPNTVLVVSAGAPVLLPWSDRAAAVLCNWFGGQEAGHALADVLLGHSDPGGRLPTTFPRSEADAPTVNAVPGEPPVISYDEGTLIGYRRYEARGVEPAFAFGHGLSYADIAIEGAEAEVLPDGGVTVRVSLHNRSARAGSEVVQVYADRAPVAADDGINQPAPGTAPRQLAGFARVAVDAGATVSAAVHILPRALGAWDVGTHCWRVPASRRVLSVGRSSADRALQLTIEVAARALGTPQP